MGEHQFGTVEKIKPRRSAKMKALCIRSLLLGVLLLPAPSLWAATYYVSTAGNDANPGTISQPWLTPNHALATAACGSLIYVRVGTYPNVNTQAVPATSCNAWNNAVTMQAYPSEAVHMAGIGVYVERYLIFQDLILDGQPNGSPGETIGIGGGANNGTGAGHIRFVNCNVHGNNTVPVLTTSSIVNIAHGSSGFNEFLGGSVHDITIGVGAATETHGFYVTQSNNLIDGVEIYNIANYGIHNYGGGLTIPANNVYRKNRIHDCGQDTSPGNNLTDFAIGLYSGDGNVAYDNVIYHTRNGINVGYGAIRALVDNNTIYGLLTAAKNYPAIYVMSGTGNAVRNNIVFGSVINTIDTSGATTPTVSNNLTTDPMFVNAAANDFHLRAGSPAIDKGVTLTFISVDFSGTVRPQGAGFDIGAYEYQTNAPLSPTNVRIVR